MGAAMSMTASYCRFDADGRLKDSWFFSFVRKLFTPDGLAMKIPGLNLTLGPKIRIRIGHDQCASRELPFKRIA
jgi:hypothetical protein